MKAFSIVLVFLALLAGTSLGQAGEDNDTKHYVLRDTLQVVGQRHVRIPEVTSLAVKFPTELHLTPASVGMVTRGVLENQNAVILSDALRNISGVNVQSQFGVHDFFFIRGFNSIDNGLVLTDGAPEPEASFYNVYNLESVEVLKGPGSFLYGGNPLSGTVNLSRKQPVFRNFVDVAGSVGRFQTYHGTFDGGFALPSLPVAMRVNAFWQGTDNYRDARDNESYAVNPALSWRVGERGLLTGNYEYVRSKIRPDAGLPIQLVPDQNGNLHQQLPDVSRRQVYQSPYDKSDQELNRVRVDYRHAVSGALTLRTKFYFTDLDWESNGTLLPVGAFPIGNRGDFLVPRFIQWLNDHQKFTGNQLEALLSFRTGPTRHRLIVGFEAVRQTDKFDLGTTSLESMDLRNPREPNILPIQLLPILPLALVDARSWNYAPYAVNQTTLSEHLQLFYGGRFDVLRYDDERIEFAGIDSLGRVTYFRRFTERNHERFSPMAAIVVSPQESVSFYANFGQSFAVPSAFISGQPQPEESTQFEAGVKLRLWEGRLHSTLAFYHLEKENIGFFGEDFLPLLGNQRSRGLELEIAAQPVQGWHAFVTYAYTDGELTDFETGNGDLSGNVPPFVPDHILNVWTSKEFNNGLAVGGGARYVSRQFIKTNNQFAIDGYVTVDAFLAYSLRFARVSVHLKNLTNTEYETRSGDFSNSVIPAHPFTATTGLEISL